MTIKNDGPLGLPLPVGETAETVAVEQKRLDDSAKAAQQQPLTQPDAPSAKGNHAVPVDPGAAKKNDEATRKSLDTLKGETQKLAQGDADGAKKALTKARTAPREDVKETADKLIAQLGQRVSYTAIVTDTMKTGPEDFAKADLKTAAQELNRVAGAPVNANRALEQLRAKVAEKFATYENALGKYDPATIVADLATVPDAEARGVLLQLGAVDADEADEWCKKVRANEPGIGKLIGDACAGRKESVAKTKAEEMARVADEAKTCTSEQAIAKTLLRFPGLASEFLAEMGCAGQAWPPSDKPGNDAPPFMHVAHQVLEDQEAMGWGTLKNGAVFLAGFVPVIGTAGMAADTAYEWSKAYSAARAARVSSAMGLIPQRQAERLDNEVINTAVIGAVGTALSMLGGGAAANVAKKLGAQGPAKALAYLAKFIETHPAVVGGLLGALNPTTANEVREDIAKGDYPVAALKAIGGILAGIAVQLGAKKAQETIGKVVSKLLANRKAALPPTNEPVKTPTNEADAAKLSQESKAAAKEPDNIAFNKAAKEGFNAISTAVKGGNSPADLAKIMGQSKNKMGLQLQSPVTPKKPPTKKA